MSESAMPTVVPAPIIDPRILWQLSSEEFNEWRRANDYPRIITVLKAKLPGFQMWMHQQEVTDALLIEHSPGLFLRDSIFYIYNILGNDGILKKYVATQKFQKDHLFVRSKQVKEIKRVIGYPVWYHKKNSKKAPAIHVNSRSGRSCKMLSCLELLDIGNCQIEGVFIGDRKLDFVNMSDLKITNCHNDSGLDISFASAINVTIEGDLAFVDAYASRFSEVYNGRRLNLKLLHGNYHRWRMKDCDIDMNLENAILNYWNIEGEYFDATLTSSDIRNSSFKSTRTYYPIQFARAEVFHRNLKQLFSDLGEKKQASRHYYYEKTYERKCFFYPKANRQALTLKYHLTRWPKFPRFAFLLRYFKSGFLNVLWGYGERPHRVFLISLFTIFVFAGCYCFIPNASAETYKNFPNALYYSSVMFTTIGDITQKTVFLKWISALEALMGLSLWGVLIAGFTNNAKDY